MVATSPLSDKDAAKRVIGADKPLKAAGIASPGRPGRGGRPAADGGQQAAGQGRGVDPADAPAGRALSALLRALPGGPRLGASRSGSAPCTPGSSWSRAPRRRCCGGSGLAATHARPGRGPARRARAPAAHPQLPALPGPGDAAGRGRCSWIPPVAEIKAHWPEDAVEVRSTADRRWWLAGGRSGRCRSPAGSGCSAATTCCCRPATASCSSRTRAGTRRCGR